MLKTKVWNTFDCKFDNLSKFTRSILVGSGTSALFHSMIVLTFFPLLSIEAIFVDLSILPMITK